MDLNSKQETAILRISLNMKNIYLYNQHLIKCFSINTWVHIDFNELWQWTIGTCTIYVKKKWIQNLKKVRKHCLTHYLLPAGTSMKLSLWYSFCIKLALYNLIELYCIVSYPSHFLYFIFDVESIMMRIRLPYKYCDTYKFGSTLLYWSPSI